MTKVNWTYSTFPVPPEPLKHPTANATVPPFAMSVTLSIWLMVPWKVALWIAEVGLATTFEMRLAKDPLVLNSDTTADAWKSVGHPSVVDHVGCWLVAPLAGFRVRLPGSRVLAAKASPAVRSPAPPIMPTAAKSTTRRRNLTARHLSLASLKGPRASLDTGIAAHATA